MLEMRIAARAGKLMPTRAVIEMIDEMVGILLRASGGMPARVSGGERA